MADSFVSRFGCYTIIWDATRVRYGRRPGSSVVVETAVLRSLRRRRSTGCGSAAGSCGYHRGTTAWPVRTHKGSS